MKWGKQTRSEKMTLGKPRGDKGTIWILGGRAFQAEGTACAKPLSLKPAWRTPEQQLKGKRGGDDPGGS